MCESKNTRSIQAHLRDTASLVLDHRNKANATIKLVTGMLWLLSAYESYVYTTLWLTKCAVVVCLKKSMDMP